MPICNTNTYCNAIFPWAPQGLNRRESTNKRIAIYTYLNTTLYILYKVHEIKWKCSNIIS